MADNDAAEGEEKKKSKLPLIIGLVVVLLGGGGAAAFFTGMFGGGESKQEEQSVDTATLPAQYIEFKPSFISNYKVEGRSRYMKIDVSVMTREDDVRVAIDRHMPALRNELVLLFGQADFEALKSLEGKKALQQSALTLTQEILQKEIGKPGIEKLLFTDFVLQ